MNITPLTILVVFLIFKFSEFILTLILDSLNIKSVKNADNIPARFNTFLTEEEYQKSRKYTISKHKFGFFTLSFDLVILLGFLFFKGFGILEIFCIHLTESETFRGIFFCLILSFGKDIIEIPISFYSTFCLEAKYGFNKMTRKLFFKDLIKKWIFSLLFGIPLIYFLLWVILNAKNNWWIYGFSGLSGFQLFFMWIYPTWIAPFFNKFTKLEDGSLRKGIMDIASKTDFKISEIFLMDGSKRSTHSNAYFTGFGKNRRIVLFDTLLKSLTDDELIAVLAHEMGHNKLKHIQQWLILSFSMSFTGFFIWSLLINFQPLYRAFSLNGNHLFPALIIFPLIIGPVSFFISPLFNIISRKHEYDADAFSVKATQSTNHMKQALLKLNKENLSNLTPHPLYSFFHYSHPTLKERLEALDNIKQ